MSAIIIILPSAPLVDSPSECDPTWNGHQAEPAVHIAHLLGGRPARGKPHLVWDRTRVVTDDDMHGGK